MDSGGTEAGNGIYSECTRLDDPVVHLKVAVTRFMCDARDTVFAADTTPHVCRRFVYYQ